MPQLPGVRGPLRPSISLIGLLALVGAAPLAAQAPEIHVEGYLQTDARFYPASGDQAPASSYLIRRARVAVEATVARYFTLHLVPDISRGTASLAEAAIGVHLDEGLNLLVGKTKPRVGLEPSQKSADLHLIERGLPAYLLAARDIGIDLGGQLFGRTVTYDVGVFNGVPDYGTSNEDASSPKDLVGRVFITPFAGQGDHPPVDLGFGVGASTGTEHGTPELSETSTLRSPGQATILEYRAGLPGETVVADGRRSRLDPQAYLYRGSFGVMAEYAQSRHALRRGQSTGTFTSTAWQVAGSFFLTGERAGFGTITPKHELDPERHHWGAVELAARVESVDADAGAFPAFVDPDVSARRARGVGIGVNWYFARRTKLMIEYEHTTFEGGAPDGDRAPENFLAARLQVAR
jgi:phosphate-selective porin OprO and OprP